MGISQGICDVPPMTEAYGDTRDRSVVEDDRSAVEILTALMEGTARQTGLDFFDALVEHLAGVLDARHAIIGRVRPDGRVHTLSAWSNGRLAAPFSYELAGSPCENVMKQGACVHPAGVCEAFPSDSLLVEMGVESYVGAALAAEPGRPIGVLCVLDDEPVPKQRVDTSTTILEIFASRAMAELDRIEAHEALLEQHRLLEATLSERSAQLTDALGRLDRNARLAALGTLASGIAHEINNPLGAIRLVCEELRRDGASPEVRERSIERLVDHVDRCATIVRGVKRFATEETLEKTPLSVDDCVRHALEVCRDDATNRHIELQSELHASGACVEANRVEIEQVVTNLVRNATEATDATQVLVRTRTERGSVIIEVEDDGAGITETDRAQVFDPFFTTRREQGGTGLGLSICHAIVRAHGGAIDALPRDAGGTIARVELPRIV